MVACQKGLSLLELLVVFVIIALVSTVLLQGMGFGLALYDRVQHREKRLTEEILVQAWFRQVNNSLVADVESVSLDGTEQLVSGTTFQPLLGVAGRSAPINWRIEDQMLRYQEDEADIALLELPPGAVFEFRDAAGGWHGRWPIDFTEPEKLPVSIRILTENGPTLTASVRVRRSPNLVLEENRRDRQ